MAVFSSPGTLSPQGASILLLRRIGLLKAVLVGVITLSLGACAGMRPGPAEDVSEAPETSAPEVSSQGVQAQVPPAELDADTLYEILVAEIAGHRGQLDLSVKNYLAVARKTRDPRVAERATRIAVYARDDTDILEAARLWVALSPDSPEAHRVLAAVFIRQGRVQAAVHELETLLAMADGNPEHAYPLLVEILARERDKQKALETMAQFMAQRPDDPRAVYAHASLAIRAGELERAAAVLSKHLAQHPEDRKALLLYTRVLQEQGKTSEALRYLGQVLAQEPDNPTYRMAYARLLVSANRFDDALVEFRTLAKQKPEDGDIRYALGLLLLQTNRLEEAEREFKTLIKLNKQVLTAKYYLGQLAETREDLKTAVRYYREVDQGPHHVDAQVRIAVLLAKQDRYDEAREHLHGIQARDSSESVRLYLVESELLADGDKLAEAMVVYDRSLEEFPDHTDLLYARAMLAEKMDRLDILERDLRAIIAREPNNAQALNALGYTLADRTERYKEARGFIEQALKLKPDDYYVLDSMGWVLYRLGKPNEALTYLRRAAELSDDVEVAAHLGEVLWVTGDQAGAREVWDSALKTTPDNERLLEVIKRFKK